GPAPVTVFHEGSVLATSAYKGTTVSLDQIRGIAEVVRLSEIYFKVIPTSVSTVTIHPVRRTKDEMDTLMKSELGKQDEDFRVLWEEDFRPETSILLILILASSLKKLKIKKIVHIKNVPGGNTQIYGAPVFDKQWMLNLRDPFSSQRKRKMPVRRAPLQTQTESQIDTDVEEDVMPETKGSFISEFMNLEDASMTRFKYSDIIASKIQ
ncbi:hypothetical protein BDR06DRAFT_978224, partial [Suillus hirtellus]